MVSLAAGPPETMASASVTSAPLADVAFIDADGDAAASDSDTSERTGTADRTARPPPPHDGSSEKMTPLAVGTPTATPRPLKSAMKRGSARPRLQVVINESRNTYCEATPRPAEEAPLLVRALSLRLPEVLSCQTPAEVTLSPPDAFQHMVAAGDILQETAVDDSEGSECSADGLETPAGPAPLARLDDDITLETAEGGASRPEMSEGGATESEMSDGGVSESDLSDGGAKEPNMSDSGAPGLENIAAVSPGPSDTSETTEQRDQRRCPMDGAAETRGAQQAWLDVVERTSDEAAPGRPEQHVGAAVDETAVEAVDTAPVQSGGAAHSTEAAEILVEGAVQSQTEAANSDDSGTCTPSPQPSSPPSPAGRAPPAAWRNLPDLVSDGARAAAGSDPPSPPAAGRSVLTIANVQQHDKVMEIADSRAEGLLSGILKGGRLWAGSRGGGDSDDSGDSQARRGGRSVRFERPPPAPAPAPRLLPPPPADSDGESSLSSLETVIARSGAARPAQPDSPPPAEQGELTGGGGHSAALEAVRRRALAELALAAGLGRSGADVARAIECNSLRRSLARANDVRLSQGKCGSAAAPCRPAADADTAGLAAPDSDEGPLSVGAGVQKTPRGVGSTPCETPVASPPSGRSLFSSPPDIEVPGDVREWKLSETLWPTADLPPTAASSGSADAAPAHTQTPAPNPNTAPAPIPTPAPVPSPTLVCSSAPVTSAAPPTPAPRVSEPARERVARPAGANPAPPQQPVQRLDSLLAAGGDPGGAVTPRSRQPPPEPRRLQLMSPGGRKAADSRIHLAAQRLFNQPAQQSSRPAEQSSQPAQQSSRQSQQPSQSTQHSLQPAQRTGLPVQSSQPAKRCSRPPGRQASLQSSQQAAQRLSASEGARQQAGGRSQEVVQWPSQQPARPACRQLSDGLGEAGERHSAASSADSRSSQESRDSRSSRDSYSLDDIDDALSEAVPAASPSPAKAGSADSGYGSTDGHAGAESDELAAFAEREAARTERIRQRYAAATEEDGSFARRASVRGIKPRFESTTEILRQLHSRPAPHWCRPATALGSTDALYAPEGPEPRRLRYGSEQHLPQAEEWRRPGPAAPPPRGYVYPEYQPPRGPPLPPRPGQVRPTAAPASLHQSTPNLHLPQPPARWTERLDPAGWTERLDPAGWTGRLDPAGWTERLDPAGWTGRLDPAGWTERLDPAGWTGRRDPAGEPLLRPGPPLTRPFSSSDIYPEPRAGYGAPPTPHVHPHQPDS